ncbi:MAG: TonB-dependent receptor [Chitinivibrionales bacterium]|nr:TonB-dependent receptor [Chitinivibrionales bacterium]
MSPRTMILPVLAVVAICAGENSDVIDDLSLSGLMNIEITTASKRKETVFEAPSNVTVVTARQISEWGSRDIKDVLRRGVGYPLIADRDEWVFAARGNVSDNNQKYLILIDGHRMNSIENFGPGQIIELPNNLSNVSRIEIIRGPGSAVWGPDALAGVINIITCTAEDLGERMVRGQVRIGQDDYYVADVQVGQRLNKDVDFMLMGSFAKQGGRKITESAATTLPILETATGYGDHPHGAYTTMLDKHRPGYMLQFKGNAGELGINAYAFSTEVFNRHFEWGRGRENYLTTHKTFVEGIYEKNWFSDLVTTAKVSSDFNRAEYFPMVQGEPQKLPFNIVWMDRRFGTSLDVQKSFWSERIELNGGMDYAFTKIGPNQSVNDINPDDPKNRDDTLSIGLTDSMRALDSLELGYLKNGYWTDPYLEDDQLGGYAMLNIQPITYLAFVLGIRGDYNPDRGDDSYNFNPRVALMAYPFEQTALKIIYNKGFLRPANFQSAGARVESEEMNQIDIQWLQKLGLVSFAATYYWQELKGFINILSGISYKGFANSGDYQSQGVEVDATLRLLERHEIWTNGYYSIATGTNFPKDLAYNSVRVDLDGYLLSYPRYIANLGATARFFKEKVFCTPALRVVAPVKYRTAPAGSAEVDSEANYATTNRFYYLDLNIGYSPYDFMDIYLYLDNITDITDQNHLTVWNGTLGQYGRHVSLGMRFRF